MRHREKLNSIIHPYHPNDYKASNPISDFNLNDRSNEIDTFDINLKELCCSQNDSTFTLIEKNKKLYQYVIKLTNKLAKLNDNFDIIQLNYEKEKEEMIKKLDSIAKNYKVFAESHKKIVLLEKNYSKLYETYQIYQNYTRLSLNDVYGIFSLITNKNKKREGETMTILDKIKTEIVNNMKNYQIMLKNNGFEEFFNKFELKVKYSMNNHSYQTDNNHFKEKNITSKTKADKDFSDIAQSIEMNMERLHLSLHKYNKGRNTQNRIISSRSYQTNSNKDLNSQTFENTNDINNRDLIKKETNTTLSNPFVNISNNQENIDQEEKIKEPSAFIISEIDEKIEKKQIIELNVDNNKELKNDIDIKNVKQSNKKDIEEIILNDKTLLSNLILTATAIFDFDSSRPEELSFNKGDVLEIEMLEGTRWKGTLNGKTGLIPYNYVRIN